MFIPKNHSGKYFSGKRFRKTRKISSPFTYVPARCRGEPYVRPRTNNAFVPMYGAHFKKGGIFLALKGLYIPAQGNALGKF